MVSSAQKSQKSDPAIPTNTPRLFLDSQSSPSSNRWNRNDNSGSTFHQTVTTSQDTQSGPTKRLYIGNLPNINPQSTVESNITSLFQSLGIELTSISKLISPHESKRDIPGDHHYLFVDLARAEDADVAIDALDGPGKVSSDVEWIGEEGLKVNRARDRDRDRTGDGRRQQGGYGQREGGGYQQRRGDGFRDWRKAERQEE